MTGVLKLLHPFMPFITEEIWQTLPHDGESIMIADWPTYDASLNFEEDEQEFDRVVKAIRAVRNRRAEMNVAPSKKAHIAIDTTYTETFANGAVFFERLASASSTEVGNGLKLENALTVITDDARIYIPMGELIDFEAERARLQKEREAVQKDIAFFEAKLSNPGFVSKAPEAVVNGQREQLARHREKLARIDEHLSELQ